MELILQRLSPIVLTWAAVAFLGLGISVLTYLLLRRKLKRQEKISHRVVFELKQFVQDVIDMLQHNMWAELIRGSAQLIAILLILGYVTNIIDGPVVGWGLVAMNSLIVVGSLNEFLTTLKLSEKDD